MSFLSYIFGSKKKEEVVVVQENCIIIDVRTADEFAGGHLKDAMNIDILDPNFKARLKSLNKDENYKIYCRSGNRSGQAERLMKLLGFSQVENVGAVSQAARKLNREII